MSDFLFVVGVGLAPVVLMGIGLRFCAWLDRRRLRKTKTHWDEMSWPGFAEEVFIEMICMACGLAMTIYGCIIGKIFGKREGQPK